MTRIVIWSVVAALVVAVLAWLAFPYLFEQRTRTVTLLPSKEVLQNPYLATQRLLANMGGSAQRLQAPYQVFKTERMNVLLIPAGRGSLSQAWMQQVRSWVQAGGHAVIESEFYSFPDPLLDTWNVERTEVNRAARSEVLKNNQNREYLVQVRVPDREDTYRLNLVPYLSLAAPRAQILSQDEVAVHALQFQDGLGKITVISQMRFLTNDSIGSFDHAEFFWSLVGTQSAPQVIILDLQALSLTDWLMHHAWPVLLTLGALIMFWLWSVLPRFGPVAPDPPAENRRFHEHLLASARLLWQAGLTAALSDYARQAALHLIRRQQPFFTDLSRSQQAEILRQRYSLSEAQIHDFLQPIMPKRQQEFIRSIRLYRQIQLRAQQHTFTTTGH